VSADVLFEPLRFRSLTVKNRILRSNVSGRFDNYDGSGTQARINWEEKFARGGVGAIVSSYDGDTERMMREIMSVYTPTGFEEAAR
jgi:2,4-dienoyl-CoA reductase-like NADH-dependent reductase (Old Yellow Enzyme family)